MARCRPILLVLTLLLAVGLPTPAAAYVPGLEELYQRIAARQPAIQRAMLETRTYVFDPLFRLGRAPEDSNLDALPPEVAERSFRQRIWWIRNTFLGIETLAEDGTLLHFYLDEGFRPVQASQAGRQFSETDVVHPYLPFVSADPVRWRQALTFWGLNPGTVDIARGPKGEPLYRLLEDEGKALWVEPELLRPVKLRTRLASGDGPGRQLTIEFGEFIFIGDQPNDADNFYFPRTVNFLLNGRLFKQTVLLRFEADPSLQGFPITRLRKLAGSVQPPQPVSLHPTPWEAR
jgi:hypothetical protein